MTSTEHIHLLKNMLSSVITMLSSSVEVLDAAEKGCSERTTQKPGQPEPEPVKPDEPATQTCSAVSESTPVRKRRVQRAPGTGGLSCTRGIWTLRLRVGGKHIGVSLRNPDGSRTRNREEAEAAADRYLASQNQSAQPTPAQEAQLQQLTEALNQLVTNEKEQ